MFIVGIDIAKHTHVAAILDEKGDLQGKQFKFSNTIDGNNLLLEKMSEVSANIADFVIGMEATGHYWLSLYSKLIEVGYTVHVINPVQSDALRGLYIRKTKTDNKDAVIIADVIRIGRYSESVISDGDIIELRDLTRQRFYLVDMMSDIKRKVITLLDKVFPEYATLFTDIFGATSMVLLETYTTPDEMANVSTDDLYSLLKKVSKGRMKLEKAEEIQHLAKNTFGTILGRDSCAFLIKQLVEQLRFLESQLGELEKEIAIRLEKFDTPIQTITGIGPTLGASILAEIGDISRFETPDKLAAFAGIDPTVQQSGQFEGTKSKMSKRGSPYLRRSLWLAATVAVNHDPALRAFYERKRAQGKHHYTAIGAVCKKLCNIIFAVLNSGNAYIPAISANP